MKDKSNHWKPITNVMNTLADKGVGPLPESDIFTKLISDVLFLGSVVVPATSLICNPCSDKWLQKKNRREVLEYLIKEKKLLSFSYGKGQSFEEIVEKLIEKQSLGITATTKEKARENAKEWDDIFKYGGEKIILDLKEINNIKMDISFQFIRNLQHSRLSLSQFQPILLEEAQEALDNKQALDGIFWSGLWKKHDALSNFQNQIQAIGAMAYDFPHAIVSDRLLTGHPYNQNFSSLIELTQPFLPERAGTLDYFTFEKQSVDSVAFLKDVIEHINVRRLDTWKKDNQLQQKQLEFHKTLQNLNKPDKQEALADVINKFHEYADTLGAYIRTTPMVEYLRQYSKVKRLQCKFKHHIRAKSIVTALCVSSALSGIGTTTYLKQGIIPLILILTASSIAYYARRSYIEYVKKLDDEQKKENKILDEMTPYNFTINLKNKNSL